MNSDGLDLHDKDLENTFELVYTVNNLLDDLETEIKDLADSICNWREQNILLESPNFVLEFPEIIEFQSRGTWDETDAKTEVLNAWYEDNPNIHRLLTHRETIADVFFKDPSDWTQDDRDWADQIDQIRRGKVLPPLLMGDSFDAATTSFSKQLVDAFLAWKENLE